MDEKYKTLQLLYSIVRDDPDPTTYPCTYRELILKTNTDATILQQHTEMLAEEGMVQIKRFERAVICITPKGIQTSRDFLRSERKV